MTTGGRVRALLLALLILFSSAVSGVGALSENSETTNTLSDDGELALSARGLQANDWPTEGHDTTRSGSNPNSSGPKTEPTARWIYEFSNDDIDIPAVTADGLVFVPGYQSLRAVNNETGEEVWNVTGIDIESVTVSEGVVLTTEIDSSGDEIRAYYATNGTEIWNQTGIEVDTSVVLDGTFYASQGEYLYAYDLHTGTQLWYENTYHGLGGGLSAAGNTIYATGFVDSGVSAVFAMNASDASERWRFEMDGTVSMHPVLANGSVYVGAGSEPRDSTNGAYDPKFYRLNETDGHVEWSFDVNTRPHGAAVANGSVYMAAGNSIYGLDDATGERQWIHRLSGSLDYGLTYSRMDALPPAVANGTVYATNDRGHLVALDGATGTDLWSYRLEGEPTRLAIADDRVYVHAIDNDNSDDMTRVYALEEAPFQFSGFSLSKTTVEPGEQFTADVTIENVDDETRTYNLSLMADPPLPVDWWALDRSNGTLGSGQSTTLQFSGRLNTSGSWNISIKRLLETDAAVDPVTVDVVHATRDDEWSQTDFDSARTKYNPDTFGPKQHLQEVWNQTNFDDYLEPVIANGSVYAVHDRNANAEWADLVAAYDETTGTLQWEFNVSAQDRRLAGSPAFYNDTLYLYTTPYNYDSTGPSVHDASVFALNASDGSVEWRYDTTMNYSSASNDQEPVVANGTVYVAGGRVDDYGDVNASVLAIDAASGSKEWWYNINEDGTDEKFRSVAIENGTVVATLSDQNSDGPPHYYGLYAIDAYSGNYRWSTSGLTLDMDDPPAVRDGHVYVVNETTNAAGDSADTLFALNVSDGSVHWEFVPYDLDPIVDDWRAYPPVVTDDAVYLRQMMLDSSPHRNEIYRLDPATGDIVWNRSVPTLLDFMVVDGLIYAGDSVGGWNDGDDTFIYDAETGEYYGETDIGQRAQGSVKAVANGTMVTFADSTTPNDFRVLREGGIIEYTDLTVDSHIVGVDQNVTVTATATNRGSYAREYDVNLLVAPDQDHYIWNHQNREGLLQPGQSTTITWVVEMRERGDFVFTLQSADDGRSMVHHMYNNAGSATVNVGDTGDGRVFDLGGPRNLAPGPNSWPKKGYDSGNTANGSVNTAPTAVGSDVVNWSINHSYSWTSGPTVANDTVFVGGSDDSVPDSVYAYNATDGSLRWRYPTVSSSEIEVPPVYASGYLYAAASDGRVYQLNASTAERLWTFDAGDVAGLTVVDNVVYVVGETANEDAIYALNATTREILWTFTKPSNGYGMAGPAVENGTVYVTHDNQGTYAVNASTGVEEWSRAIAGDGSSLHSPVAGDGVVYVDDAAYSKTDANVYALDATDGSTLWSVPANVEGYTGASPALANDTLFFLADGLLQAVDVTTGDHRWNASVCEETEYSPVYADGMVFVPLYDSTIRAYDADSGDLVWRYEGYYGESFTPAVVDGLLYTTGLEVDDYDDPYTLAALAGGTTNTSSLGFDYTSLYVYPTDATVGEEVYVDADVENTQSGACTYTAEFKIDGQVEDTKSNQLAGSATETVDFAWYPSATGTYNLTIGDLSPIQVNVTGPAPEIATSTRYDFGDVNVSTTENANSVIYVTNNGQVPLNWTGSAVTGANASAFSISGTTSGIVQNGVYEWITLSVHSSEIGPKSATLEIYSNDTATGTVDIPITANIVSTDPNASVSPRSYDFGNVDNGITDTYNVTVTNDGASTLTYQGVEQSGDSEFQITAGNGTETLASGESHEFTVSFSPTATGSYNANLDVITDDPDNPRVTVSVTGTGVQPTEPNITVTPNTLDFGAVVAGSSTTANVTIGNDGNDDLSISVSPFEGGSPAFMIVAGTGSTVVAPGGTHNVTVRFSPSFPGTYSSSMGVTNNDSFVSVSIVGEAIEQNRVPVAAADHYVTVEGENLSVSAPGRLVNDLDPNGDSFDASHHSNPNHGTLHHSSSDGSFLYEPDPGFTGTDSYVYRVRDSRGAYSSFVPVTIEVLPDPNRAPQAVDDVYSVHAGETLTVSGPGRLANDYDLDNDSFSASHHGDVDHGTLVTSATDGSFEYTPDPWFTGTDSYVYRVQDEHGEYSTFATVTIEVLPPKNRAPTAVADTYTVSEGEWLNVSGPGRLANDYDVDNDSFSASHHGSPSHGTLQWSSQDGSFRYKPDAGFTGTDSYVYRIRDDRGEYSSFATVTINVVDDNRPPTVVPDNYATLAGENLSVSGPGRLANDYDLDNDGFSASHHGDVDNGTLHTSATDGSILYEPDPSFTGTDSYVYRVRDDRGEYSDYETVSIEVVDPAGTNPVAIDDHYTVYEGEWLNVSGPGVIANDIDPNGDTFDAPLHGSPDNGTLKWFYSNGGFNYTAYDGFTGTDSFVYKINDSTGDDSNYATVTIEVLPDPDTTGNRDPVVVDDHYTIYEGEWLNVSGPGRLANDYDVDNDSFSASHHGDVDHGTLYRSATDGSFEYKPDDGFTGTDSYVYRVRDEHGEYSGFGTVTIEVVPHPDETGNRKPQAIDDHYTVSEGEWLNVSGPGRLANDRDPDDDSFSASHHGDVDHGTLQWSSQDGSFRYKPDAGFTGTDSYVYRVQDEHGEYSSFATVTIEVIPEPNRAPMVVPDNYVVMQGQSLTVNAPGRLANDYDPDNDSFSASHHGDVDHGTLQWSSQDGSFTYVPDAGFTGVDSYVYRVQDEHGEYSGFGEVTITVIDGSISGQADVAVPQDSVDFGYVPAGQNRTETVTVANIGDQNLTVYGATISGANASAFDVIAGNSTTVLGYGGTTTLTVEYAPTVGESDALLTVLTNDTDEPTVNVTLSGEGYDDDAPTIHAVDVTGSYVDDSDPANGTIVYENETATFEVNVTDAYGSVRDVTISLDAQSSGDQASTGATENTTTGNWTASIDVSTLTDGRYDVTVDADDQRGNDESVTLNDTIVVDTTAPSLSATVTRLGGTKANVTVRAPEELRPGSLDVTVEDPDGTVSSVSMTDEGDHWNGTFTLPKDGQYNITARAADLAGNRGSDDATARFANASTDANNTITIQMQPSGLFVRFTTNRSVNNTFITMTESKVPVKPLVNGQAPVKFLDAVLGKKLTQNLSYAVVGIPVDTSLLKPGTDVDDVTIRHFNETRQQWTTVPTTVQNVTVNGTTDQYWVATVPHFSTYGAVASDATPPTITSMDPVDGDELSAGTTTKTLRVEFEDAVGDIDTSQVTVVYDGTIVNGESATTITSSYVEYEATGLTDGSSHDLEVTVADDAGNDVTETLSFTVDSTSNGGGSGSGGSSGGGGSVPPPSILMDVADIDGGVLVTIQNGRAGATGRTSLSVGNGGIEFTQLDLAFARDTSEFTVELRPDGAPPAAAPTMTGAEAFRFFDVNVAGATDADLDHADLRFSLDRGTLPEGASLRDVSVYRYHDGSWNRLEVERSGSSFTVTTPGFSTFAVAIDRPTFVVDTFAADTTSVAVGEPVSLTAEIQNDGEGDGTYQAVLEVAGKPVDSREVSVAAGDSKTVTFDWTFEKAGNYEVSLGDSSTTITVESAGETTNDSGTTQETTTPEGGQPGFGPVVAILAMLAAALVSRRRRDDGLNR